MANEFLKYSYAVDLFANTAHCQQLKADTDILGERWIKVESVDVLPESTRGIYLIALVSPYKLESLESNHIFRHTLFVDKTDDVRDTYSAEQILSIEKLRELAKVQEGLALETLSDIEFWFLSIPDVSMDLIDKLLSKLINIFNPPYNLKTVQPIKASTVTNLSAPAF